MRPDPTEGKGPGAWVGNGRDEPDVWVDNLWPCSYCGEGHIRRSWSEPDGRCLWRTVVEQRPKQPEAIGG